MAVRNATLGIIFFGAPYRGSDKSGLWQGAGQRGPDHDAKAASPPPVRPPDQQRRAVAAEVGLSLPAAAVPGD